MQHEKWLALLRDLGTALSETALMVGIGLVLALIFGLPLGLLLYLAKEGAPLESKWIMRIGGAVINFVRSLPFVILLILFLPLSRIVTGHSTGATAASVPLAIASIAFFARLAEAAFCEVDRGVIEASQSVGASTWLIVREVLLPEALPGLIRAFTVTTISLVGYTAMAGVVGGGGIGFLAINYGYYRYETAVMVVTVAILIAIVQSIQWLGDWAARLAEPR
ncbi:MAG: methionine ABC transporter permease [Polyangiaceae bacterium]